MAKLKVYRTPAGFHDAYVAATSQKAALAAWGSDADLFARGIAEVVTDPALTKAPLAKPGEIIKRPRTAAEAMPEPAARPRAHPSSKEAPAKPASRKVPPPARPRRQPRPKPRPSRAKLDAAEQALADAETRHAEARAALKQEEAALAERRRALDRDREEETARLETARDTARTRYDRALTKWRDT